MISSGDIATILYWDVKAHPVLGLIPEIAKDVHEPVEEGSVKERIVIVIPGGVDNEQVARAFPRICIYVPDIQRTASNGSKYYTKDSQRLTELERECINAYRSSVYGKLSEDAYTYVFDTVTQERDHETWSSFLNVRLRFEIVNTKL
jgi:hypothetical protein